MLSRELEVTLNLAFKNAQEKRHEFMTVEHLLLALLDDASATKVLKACGVDLNIYVKTSLSLSTLQSLKYPTLRPMLKRSQLTAFSAFFNVRFSG